MSNATFDPDRACLQRCGDAVHAVFRLKEPLPAGESLVVVYSDEHGDLCSGFFYGDGSKYGAGGKSIYDLINTPEKVLGAAPDFGFPFEILEGEKKDACDRDVAARLRDAVYYGIDWNATIEGPSFWRQVWNALKRIAEDGR